MTAEELDVIIGISWNCECRDCFCFMSKDNSTGLKALDQGDWTGPVDPEGQQASFHYCVPQRS